MLYAFGNSGEVMIMAFFKNTGRVFELDDI